MFSKEVKRSLLEKMGEIKEYEPEKVKLAVPIEKSQKIAAEILEKLPVEDINIEDPDIETIIRYIFESKKIE